MATTYLKRRLAVSALGLSVGISAVTVGLSAAALIALKVGAALLVVNPIGLGIILSLSALVLILSAIVLHFTNKVAVEDRSHRVSHAEEIQTITAVSQITGRPASLKLKPNQVINFNREMIFSVLMGMLSTAALVSIFILSGVGLVSGFTPALIAVSVLPAVIASVEPLIAPAFKATANYFSSRSNTKVDKLNSLDPKGVHVGEGLFVTSPELLERRGVSPLPSVVAMYNEAQKSNEPSFMGKVARTLNF
ncbi:MAG TPA: hypothetical protein VD770_01525 [Coxiellaceae bacterium]|nr:hypothetical protein [Coxiellaceae bacterium]